MRITFEIPEDSAPRLRSAYESNDPELRKYLSGALPVMLRDLHEGRLEAELTRRGNPLILLDNMCSRFHLVVKRLGDRYDGRQALRISDEYDVQDLLAAILCLHFTDIRREEWVPSYAGKNARADFLLKQEKVIIEVKMVSPHLKERQLHDQLLAPNGFLGNCC